MTFLDDNSNKNAFTKTTSYNQNAPIAPQYVNSNDIFKQSKVSQPMKYEDLDLKKFKNSDFDFGQRLGKGKFGDVYLAREKRTNFITAIKVLDKASIRQMKAQKQVIREIKIHSYLNHKNIIKLYGVFHDEEKVYMILEYAPGGELYREMKRSVKPTPIKTLPKF